MAARIRSIRFDPPDLRGWQRIEIDADVDPETAAALMQLFKDEVRGDRYRRGVGRSYDRPPMNPFELRARSPAPLPAAPTRALPPAIIDGEFDDD